MRPSWREYINEFFWGATVFVGIGVVESIVGYGYSPITGVVSINNKVTNMILMSSIAAFWLVLDIIYVQLKRHYRKKGYYKDEKK